MRKLILLSSVFVLAMGVFAQVEVEAAGKALEVTQGKVLDEVKDIVVEVRDGFNKLYEELKLLSQQSTTAGVSNTAYGASVASAGNLARAITAKETAMLGSVVTHLNAGGQNCVIASGGKGTMIITEGAGNETEKLIEERMKNINSEAGTDAENGLVDFQRKMFERSKALCDPAGNGGANTFCVGAGNEHITLSTILKPAAFKDEPPLSEQLDYLQDLLFSRIAESVKPSLLKNPDTNIMNMVVESDRIKAEMSVGQTLFSILQGNRTKIETSVAESLKERLEAGGASTETIKELTEGGVSKNAMYQALTVNSYSSEMLLQKVSGNDRDLLANIFGELALNNVLQFEQYKLLEAIALATATNIVVNRDDAIKDLNARISAANSN